MAWRRQAQGAITREANEPAWEVKMWGVGRFVKGISGVCIEERVIRAMGGCGGGGPPMDEKRGRHRPGMQECLVRCGGQRFHQVGRVVRRIVHRVLTG